MAVMHRKQKKMNDTVSFFKENKYVFVKNVMEPDECQEIMDTFFDMSKKGEVPPDSMCPLSESKYRGFDKWSLKKQSIFEEALGLTLYPTYSFARIYRPDEQLNFHVDRPSCEITTSITIGFLGEKVWPIYLLEKEESVIHLQPYLNHIQNPDINGYDGSYEIGKTFHDKIGCDVPVGDAVVFRGDEIFHWRDKYVEGAWQVQLFLHYVDANGPHAEWKYDKQGSLNI